MTRSTLYTMGTALNRACDNQLSVQLLVVGQWLTGQVVALDGFGVVLQSGLEHAVIRLDNISVVKSAAPAPDPRARPIDAGTQDPAI